MIMGYARVSTGGQTLDAQHSALTEAGAERVFSEKQSGAKTDRAQLAKAIAALTLAIPWWSVSSTAWRDQPVIYSILSQLLPMLALRSNPLAILGPIQQQPMAS